MRYRASTRMVQVVSLLLVSSAAMAAAPAGAAPPPDVVASQFVTAAADPPIDLCATTGTVTLPGPATVDVWGFVAKGAQPDCSDVAGTATLPGPVLRVANGDTITLNVTNALPAGHTLSLEVPGIDFLPGPTDAAVGETVSRTFTATAPGTYLYESVGEEERQTAMGLYGALIVGSGTAGQAYGTAASAYDVDAPLVLSTVDPAFNAAPDTFNMDDYQPQFWLIDGASYPQTGVIHASAGQRVLLRYLNAGFDNTTMMLLGMDQRVLARDAHLVPDAYDADAETIPAGQTEDTVATVPATPSGLTNGFPLYNRQLHVSNGAPTDATSPGGMLTFIGP